MTNKIFYRVVHDIQKASEKKCNRPCFKMIKGIEKPVCNIPGYPQWINDYIPAIPAEIAAHIDTKCAKEKGAKDNEPGNYIPIAINKKFFYCQ